VVAEQHRAVHTQSCSASTSSAEASCPCVTPGGTSRTSATDTSTPLFCFNLKRLPPQLQQEFDVTANQRALRHLVRKATTTRRSTADVSPEGSSECGAAVLSTPAPEMSITPSTVHPVMWRCTLCNTQWSARPSDRANTQTADAFRCPCCYGSGDAAMETFPLATKRDHSDISLPVVVSSNNTRPSCSTCGLLCDVHPALAAEWDSQRNQLLQNGVLQDVTEVHTSSSAKVWWRCPLCCTPWLESVSSRVARYEVATVSLSKAARRGAAANVAALVCPACERRGVSRAASPATLSAGPRRCLSDDRLLMSEVLLSPSQNPREISLTSETMLQWRCRTCQYEYVATVANRFLRHERCPQCTGRVPSPMNLLVIQRPDVVQEVSKYISRTRLRYITVHDDVELPFVCRTCFSPYRMTARARCAVPRGVPACSKCFWTGTQVLTEAQRQIAKTGATQLSSRARSRVRQKALQLSRSNRSSDRLAATANELQHRDGALKD
jgi:hypothetical protein